MDRYISDLANYMFGATSQHKVNIMMEPEKETL